eukprot:547378-Pyramimonas_sp.AAC.1
MTEHRKFLGRLTHAGEVLLVASGVLTQWNACAAHTQCTRFIAVRGHWACLAVFLDAEPAARL